MHHPLIWSLTGSHKGNRNKHLVCECSFRLFQASVSPEGQQSPPAAEPQDSYPSVILLKHTGNKMERNKWLFLEVAMATSSLGTPFVLEIHIFLSQVFTDKTK